jgi:L-seryl-tRNA(Ser) seleniumtransferase
VSADQATLRGLPSVDQLVGVLGGRPELAGMPRPRLTAMARETLDAERRRLLAHSGVPADVATLADRVVEAGRRAGVFSLRPLINGQGVVLHTNLGRALLSPLALERVVAVGAAYSNLELDLASKERGSRYSHVEALLGRLTGAEDALVVNNNAAAVLLSLETLARGKEVVVSRGELIEIGGEFRIPDIMLRSGAILKEVGATNRTHLRDYANAIGPHTALLLKVHTSNYRVVGFTAEVSARELTELGRARGIPVMEDLGSGSLVDLRPWGFPYEPTVPEVVASGVDLVSFSGDKLLGGPQAGIVVGRADLVERLRRHPLQRALRADKLTLAALEGTLGLYLDPERAVREVPVLRMLNDPVETVRARAERLAAAVGGEVEETVARVGGGALPLAELPSFACAVEESLAEALRTGEPPVVGVLRDGRLLLDCRTLTDAEAEEVAAAVAAARG